MKAASDIKLDKDWRDIKRRTSILGFFLLSRSELLFCLVFLRDGKGADGGGTSTSSSSNEGIKKV